MIQTAMILAAGRGSRMKHLTDTCPKPLIRVVGKTLLETILQKAKQAEITQFIVNTCYLGDQIESCLKKHPDSILFSHRHRTEEQQAVCSQLAHQH